MVEQFQEIAVTINGTLQRRRVPPDLLLLDWLQEDLGLTGTKFCCGIGVCRACTVAVQWTPGHPSEPVLACSIPAAALDGHAVTTVEGLAGPTGLSALQEAFLTAFAFQCGYCTPGFLMAAHILLARLRAAPIGRDRIDAAIDQACGAHICRCTGYASYRRAIRKVVFAELVP
ncbi:MAG TPA: 2Fe-2S iron-sulfur cluster-binding protein [Dongiaceae bacterium]|jgi:aerobic-type carbon monoxide dehydrogenase small subunit (CoxS/CutS family)|nr:2Fe-2S iron-sulfur cluster-binding protein [Dongiaceae bacterium]